MLRLVSHLLALLALLLAPLPAAATAPPPAPVAAEAEHCEQTDADASHRDSNDPQKGEKHPCCKNSTSSCCPVAARLAGCGSPQGAEAAKPSHRTRVEVFLLGTSGPPLTEPPTFA
jgi:hypothetical protein